MSFEQNPVDAGETAKPQYVKLKQAELQALFTSHVIQNSGRGTFIPTPRGNQTAPVEQKIEYQPVPIPPAPETKKKPRKRRRSSTPRTTSGEETVTFYPASELPNLVDPYKWRKYGQKNVRASNYPRHYYKCSVEGCTAKKMVEKGADGERHIWKGSHTHPPQISKQITVTSQEALKAHVKTMLSEATNKLEVYCSTDVDPGEDGYYWRKYGQKELKVSRIPRSYYKCPIDNRLIRKQVEPLLATGGWKITYNSNSQTPRQRSNTTQAQAPLVAMAGANTVPAMHPIQITGMSTMNTMPVQPLMQSNNMAHISNLPTAHVLTNPQPDINSVPPAPPVYISGNNVGAPTIPDTGLPMSSELAAPTIGAPTIGAPTIGAPTIGDIDEHARPPKKRKTIKLERPTH